jgi:hypothetical protein
MNSLSRFIYASIFMLLSTQSLTQENCTQYGDFPEEFVGQRCWLMNYLTSTIWKYNNNQKFDENYYLKINPNEIESYFNYETGAPNFYLDQNNTAWGGYWYPCKYGGIANRYQLSKYPSTASLKFTEVKDQRSGELNKKSPAEKFDLYLGLESFDVTKWELTNRGPERKDKRDDSFCGYCNGARLAGAILPEPKYDVTVKSSTNPALSITFSRADIKAIAAAHYMNAKYYFGAGKTDVAGLNDPNPAILDILLRLYLGHYKMPFFVDADPGDEIYNETILGYKRDLGKPRSPNAVETKANPDMKRVVHAVVTLYLQDELTISQSNTLTVPIMADKSAALKKSSTAASFKFWVHEMKYEYDLYIDNSNAIIGGKWTSSKPLDFLWAANGPGDDETKGNNNLKFSALLKLIRLSLVGPGGNEAIEPSGLPKINEAASNSDRQFQRQPDMFRVRQNIKPQLK